MNLNREPIKNWFGFTRRERRSTFILLLIIILIIVFRYIIPDSRIAIEDITASATDTGNFTGLSGKNIVSSEKNIYSDPKSGGRFRNSLNYKKVTENTKWDADKPVAISNVKKSAFKHVNGQYKQQKTRTDINLSDSAELVRLPGIGPVLSARIIKYRRLLGGFATIEQLQEVYGLKAETYELIKERVFADSSVIKRIDINSAGYKELSHIHYFEKYEITSIMKYRELKGRINGIDDLLENKLITEEKARKVGPYIKFEN
jgi:competence ComEA-like helix-hairpin-helix protein